MTDEDEEEEEEEAKGGEDGEGCITVDDGAGGGNRMPYLRSLPWDRRGQDHVLYWSDEEVRELLGGSRAYDDAILIRRTVDDAVVLLRDILTPIIRNIDVAEVRSSLGDGSDRDDTDDDDAHEFKPSSKHLGENQNTNGPIRAPCPRRTYRKLAGQHRRTAGE